MPLLGSDKALLASIYAMGLPAVEAWRVVDRNKLWTEQPSTLEQQRLAAQKRQPLLPDAAPRGLQGGSHGRVRDVLAVAVAEAPDRGGVQ
jgi:hypothetical protein